MNKTLEASVHTQLAAIAQKRAGGKKITTAEAMVLEYHRPCIVAVQKSPDAHGFGVGTLILTRDEVRIVCADTNDASTEFYPCEGLIRSAILQGARYPGILAGSRLVRGQYYMQVCAPARIADEKRLARIINKWRNWVPKAPQPVEENPFAS